MVCTTTFRPKLRVHINRRLEEPVEGLGFGRVGEGQLLRLGAFHLSLPFKPPSGASKTNVSQCDQGSIL
jgi:hypothetical protein